jgi:hypothetical protein
MTIQWDPRPTTRALARALRAHNRLHRTVIGEHQLSYNDLAEIWANPEETHVVLTHRADPIWQLWVLDSDDGWVFTSVHRTRTAAQAAAEETMLKVIPPGTYVIAQKGDGRLIKVACTSHERAEALSGIFEKLDYTVRIEDVA